MRKLVVLFVTMFGLAFTSHALAWTWPVEGDVVRAYAFGDDPYAAGQHRGIDIAAPAASDVRAPAAGIVTFRGFVPSGGTTLTITTEEGYAVTLQQLGTIAVAKGDAVSEGALVASVGSSSDPVTTQTHVHLGVRVASDRQGYLDPLSLLPRPTNTPGAEPVHPVEQPADNELEPEAVATDVAVEPDVSAELVPDADSQPIAQPLPLADPRTAPGRPSLVVAPAMDLLEPVEIPPASALVDGPSLGSERVPAPDAQLSPAPPITPTDSQAPTPTPEAVETTTRPALTPTPEAVERTTRPALTPTPEAVEPAIPPAPLPSPPAEAVHQPVGIALTTPASTEPAPGFATAPPEPAPSPAASAQPSTVTDVAPNPSGAAKPRPAVAPEAAQIAPRVNRQLADPNRSPSTAIGSATAAADQAETTVASPSEVTASSVEPVASLPAPADARGERRSGASDSIMRPALVPLAHPTSLADAGDAGTALAGLLLIGLGALGLTSVGWFWRRSTRRTPVPTVEPVESSDLACVLRRPRAPRCAQRGLAHERHARGNARRISLRARSQRRLQARGRRRARSARRLSVTDRSL